MDTIDDEATQPSTQAVFDPRRAGHSTSGLNDVDNADVLCILHPCSQAALQIVGTTYQRSPQHVLQSRNHAFADQSQLDALSEEETFILDDHNAPLDLALRLSSTTIRPAMGFTFGRNPGSSDIVLHIDSMKRISNQHFRIYVNDSGVIMVQDMSTNGTLVDDILLKQRGSEKEMTRMLQANSIIQILSPVAEDCIKFLVRIPARNDHSQLFVENFKLFMARVKLAEQQGEAKGTEEQRMLAGPHDKHRQVPNERAALHAASSIKPALTTSQHGMKWDGGDKFNVVGYLGKGAFANVYKIATKRDGQLFAAKELEKRKFVKNGVLDKRIENEMDIMQTVRHPSIVQYIDYYDIQHHLYIIMEFVPCGDLQGYLHCHEVLTEDQGQVMSRQVLSALAHLHDHKITHRDIKPDNILLSSETPFGVKLSDFGLSKVVHNNDTFLKTFCGTLLYCAPEVFPHYSNHTVGKGQKRRRGAHPQKLAHSYSQSVDTWSYAAVLWQSLCGSPPFEGVADQTGLAMFNKIMETSLDIKPLKFRAISAVGVDLLVKMLNTDPSQRPSERQCLTHPWLADGSVIPPKPDQALGAIDEAEEEEAVEGAAPDMSQLSINDASSRSEIPEDEVGFGSHDFDDFLDPRLSKRPRDAVHTFRENPNAKSGVSVVDKSVPVARQLDSQKGLSSSEHGNEPRLFGEIGQSALRGSSTLDVRTNVALALSHGDTSTTNDSDIHELSSIANDVSQELSDDELWGYQFSGHESGYGLDRSTKFKIGAAASLLGAESLVRDLQMESPPSANSPAAGEPSTPKTPEQPSQSATSNHTKSPHEEEITPKPPLFNRQISIPFSASFFQNQQHIEGVVSEDANKAREQSFGSSFHPTTDVTAIMDGSTDGDHTNTSTTPEVPVADSTLSTAFARPPPRLGKLTSTPDSFAQMTLSFTSRVSTWGRDPGNTHVYPTREDTRIPKRGILLWFHAKGIEEALSQNSNADWVKMEGLHTIVSTESTAGIWINGVHLKRGTKETGTLYGRVYTGDEITVFVNKGSGITPPETLAFTCEFFHGEAAEKRPEGKKFEVLKEINK